MYKFEPNDSGHFLLCVGKNKNGDYLYKIIFNSIEYGISHTGGCTKAEILISCPDLCWRKRIEEAFRKIAKYQICFVKI